MKSDAINNKIRDGSRVATFFIYAVALIICLITIYPMYYVVIRSISDPQMALGHPPVFYPRGL